MPRPEDAKYSETHEWIRLNKKGEANIGITDYAIKQLKDLVHLELPKPGESVEQGTPFGEIESVKAVEDLSSPVTGKILAVNRVIVDDLDVLKEDPFEDGWMIRVKVDDPSEIDSLMSLKEYEEFLASAKQAEEEENEEDEEESSEEDEVDEDDFM